MIFKDKKFTPRQIANKGAECPKKIAQALS
jgi:hypothetical protein